MEETLQMPVQGRPGRRKGSGKRAGAEAAWGQRAVQALADPSRWRIVRALEQGPRALGELATLIELSAACTSHHVSILRESGLVETRRQARSIRISLPSGGTQAADLLRLVAGGPTTVSLVSKPEQRSRYRPQTGAPELESPRRPSGIDIEEFLL